MAKQPAVLLYIVVLFSTQLFAESPFGRSLILSGEQQYFEVPDSIYSIVAGSDAVTIEVRFKTADTTAFSLVNNWRSNSTRAGSWDYSGEGFLADFDKTPWKIEGKIEMRYLDPLDGFPHTGYHYYCRAYIHEDGGGGWHSSSGSHNRIIRDRWHHFAVILCKGQGQAIYIDGMLVDSDNDNSEPFKPVVESPINFGGYTIALDSTLDVSSYLTGEIDEVRIWNKAVSTTMNDTVDVNSNGLVGYYRFEELTDGIVQDLSPSGNHGIAHNGAQLTEVPVADVENYEIPVTYQLHQNSPNPFNPSTKIAFDLPKAGPVSIQIYNVQGQLVQIISDSRMDAGSHEIQWSGAGLPSGVYLCKMQSGDFNKVVKMVLQK